MTHYLDDLNEQQRDALMYNDGASLVIAGAGSGKTRVLTYKIAHLIECGYAPWQIMALTFTNKAAKEMKERIGSLVGPEMAQRLWMGTFHSLFFRILRVECEALGFSRNLTIWDSDESKRMIRDIIRELSLSDKSYKPSFVQARISMAKNHLVNADAYASNNDFRAADQDSNTPAIYEVYRMYELRSMQSNAMDFDDLLLYTHRLFAEHPEVLVRYQEQFQYMLVDEFQDTNYAQYEIIRLLASSHGRLFVVGDDAQSIYSFRGARIDNILSFQTQYDPCKVFKLERNYRSTQTIVGAANSLIRNNQNRLDKTIFSEQAVGSKIMIQSAFSDQEEAAIVASRIFELRHTQQGSYGETAILYRTNAQSRILEESLRKLNIPYRIYGGQSFYTRKEIKDVIAYIKLTLNPHDESALKRAIAYPKKGIGATTLQRIQEASSISGASMWNVLCNPIGSGVNVNSGAQRKIGSFVALVAGLASTDEAENAFEHALRIVNDSGIVDDLTAERTPESQDRLDNIQELLNAVHSFCKQRSEVDEPATLEAFLNEVSLLAEVTPESEEVLEQDKLTLMTAHASKGLEFRNVCIVGMEEELFPSHRSIDSTFALEEERRLFYVAITRAEEVCHITYSNSRYLHGQMHFGRPSRFLNEIDSKYLDRRDGLAVTTPRSETSRPGLRFGGALGSAANAPFGSSSNGSFGDSFGKRQPATQPQPATTTPLSPPQRGNFKKTSELSSAKASSSFAPLTIGMRIHHERFNQGTVEAVEGSGNDMKATVRFDTGESRKLLLRFAKYTIID